MSGGVWDEGRAAAWGEGVPILQRNHTKMVIFPAASLFPSAVAPSGF
ncbi:hypothetical protein HMPREF1548_00435, partial [Clostridium sp. KLE 1755]